MMLDALLNNRTLKQTIFKNTFWLFVGQILGRVLRAVIIIYAARILGTAQWGILSYAMSFTAFLTIFTDLGINAVLTKQTSRLPLENSYTETTRRQIIATALFIKLGMVLFSLLLLNFVAPLFTKIPAAVSLFPVLGLILMFDNLREFCFSITRALERMEVEAFFYILTNLLIVAGGFVALTLNPTPLALASAYAIGTGMGMAATFAALHNHFRRFWRFFSFRLLKPIFIAAWPFALLGIMGSLMISTDMLILGWFRTAEELGFYAAAQKPIQALYILPTLVATSLFPTLTRLARINDEHLARLLEKAFRFLLLVAIPVVLIGIILGEDIIRLVFGPSYLPATPSWQILIATVIIVFPSMIIGNAIFAYDQQLLFLPVLAIGVISNIILDILFIPRWGGPGSAVATLLSQLFVNGFLWIKLRRINPHFRQPQLKPIILAGLGLAGTLAAMQLLNIPFLVNAALASLLYLLILYTVKEPTLTWLRLS